VARESTPIATPPDAQEVEAALGVVTGVARAVVVRDGDGVPAVLRIWLAPDGDAAVVARAAHRILRLQFGVGLDPARIEVVDEAVPEPLMAPPPPLRVAEESYDGVLELGAEIDALLASLDGDQGPGRRFDPEVLASAARHPAGLGPPAPVLDDATSVVLDGHDTAPRLALARLTLSTDGLGVEATVSLTRGEHEHTGTAEGPATPASVHRVVAAATLAALAGVLGRDHRVDVEAVTVTPMGDGMVAVVQVLWSSFEGNERLTGASEVREDPRQAVIRATLDAVNRRLAPHLES